MRAKIVTCTLLDVVGTGLSLPTLADNDADAPLDDPPAHPGVIRRLAVSGDSMLPTLASGDRLLVVRTGRYRPGDLIAIVDPRHTDLPRRQRRVMVKRLAAVDGRRALTVLGDNPGASTDSRELGDIPRAAVVGRVVYRYAPPARAGWVRRGP